MDREVLCFDRDLGFLTYTFCSVFTLACTRYKNVLQKESSSFFIREFLSQGLGKPSSAQARLAHLAEPDCQPWFASWNWR